MSKMTTQRAIEYFKSIRHPIHASEIIPNNVDTYQEAIDKAIEVMEESIMNNKMDKLDNYLEETRGYE